MSTRRGKPLAAGSQESEPDPRGPRGGAGQTYPPVSVRGETWGIEPDPRGRGSGPGRLVPLFPEALSGGKLSQTPGRRAGVPGESCARLLARSEGVSRGTPSRVGGRQRDTGPSSGNGAPRRGPGAAVGWGRAAAAGVAVPVAPQAFRHAFAAHRWEDGYDIRTVHD